MRDRKLNTHLKLKGVHLGIWRWDGHVLTGGTTQAFAAWVLRTMKQTITPHEGAAGHAFLHDGYPWAIWVEDLARVPVLAHEALHITAGILEARGLQFAEAGEEAYTYTMQYIMDETLRKGGWSRAR